MPSEKAYLIAIEVDRRLQMSLSNSRFEVLVEVCDFYEEQFIISKTRKQMFALLDQWESR